MVSPFKCLLSVIRDCVSVGECVYVCSHFDLLIILPIITNAHMVQLTVKRAISPKQGADTEGQVAMWFLLRLTDREELNTSCCLHYHVFRCNNWLLVLRSRINCVFLHPLTYHSFYNSRILAEALPTFCHVSEENRVMFV